MPDPFFEPGKTYQRRTIHSLYGGNPQSGISPSARYPYIFIFTGSSGHQHGYRDQWENENVFSYTGEGQTGNMQFVRGNLELREHKSRGKRVFLFTYIQKGYVQYEGEMEVEDVDFFATPDRNGTVRTGIKFFFKRVGISLGYNPEHTELSLLQDPPASYSINIPNVTERKGLVTSRVGQGAYRKSILHRWNFRCAVTNYKEKEVLIASHIVPWKDATNEERLDVSNGILLSPTYDALFDQQLISFENKGRILLSPHLEQTNYWEIGVTGKERISNFVQDNFAYLERHREMVFGGNHKTEFIL